MPHSRARRIWALVGSATVVVVIGGLAYRLIASGPSITRNSLEQALGDSTSFYHFPTEVDLADESHFSVHSPIHAVIEYSFDHKLQDHMESLFQYYRPDYGAFVALDATTGRVLSMVSYSSHPQVKDNLALRATFPSASVFKVVTAAAAIEERKFNANTVVAFTGANHTLYRHNVLKTRYNRWTRYATLKEAFAKSINTVFAKIGAYNLQPDQLRMYAKRFGFNRTIASDVPVQEGHAPIPQDPWGVAEAASGFTRQNTMSPLQGALIAASIVNDGVMMDPYIVQSVYRKDDGATIYSAQPTIANQVVDAKTAREIRKLMRATVTSGTCRVSFRGFHRRECALIDVGGKTGTLNGNDPRGRYDWFVGFADNGNQKLAFASLTIHGNYWRVKSSVLARKAIEAYFKDKTPGKDYVSK